MNKLASILLIIATCVLVSSCRKSGCTNPNAVNYNASAKVDDGSCICLSASAATPYNLKIPASFQRFLPPPVFPVDNPMTVEGVALGKKLFFDKRLSDDLSLACASCHLPSQSFDDTSRFSVGINGIAGTRNEMPLFNHAWNITNKFFWDGRAVGIEEQALEPVTNVIEMHDTWINVTSKISSDATYRTMFTNAFGSLPIDSNLITKAIAQYERTLISGNTRIDAYSLRLIGLTPSELSGLNLFMDENGADCFHCHGDVTNPLWTDNSFRNNGLDSVFADSGLASITGNPIDVGKFKTPSLRNLIYTAPYMHDGRFSTLDEVIDHYSEGLVNSPSIDVDMKNISTNGARLTSQEKSDLKAFLLALTDTTFVTAH